MTPSRPRVHLRFGARSAVTAVLVMGLAAAGCGTTSPSSGAPSPSATEAPPTPHPTRWPSGIALAVTTLGVADNDIKAAGTDLEHAASTEDVNLMLSASDGLAKTVASLQPSVDKLSTFEHTKAIAAQYNVALPLLHDGAKKIHDSLAAGDSAGVEAGFTTLQKGWVEYDKVRAPLSDLVTESLAQQRLLEQ
jgi:hypothetical protein